MHARVRQTTKTASLRLRVSVFHKFPSKKGPNLLLQQQTFFGRQEVLERTGQGNTNVGQFSEVLPVPDLVSDFVSPG